MKNLDHAIHDKRVILEPYSPFTGFRVAMIDDNGWPVEFIETTLSEEEIWDEETHKNSVIYPQD